MLQVILALGLSAFISTSVSAETSASVAVSLTPAGDFTGTTNKVQGHAYKTGDGVAAENIQVDLRDIKTKIELRDKHTKKHLETDKYPYAKLIKATGKDGKGSALVEIHGVKQEVQGKYKIAGNELHAEFKLHLPDVKIENISYMGVGVDDDVTIKVSVPLKEKK